jgi:SAM-dependent methyltransferase
MPVRMGEFYMYEPSGSTFATLLKGHLASGAIKPGDSVFVQFGGRFDEQVCQSVGLTNFTIANITAEALSVGETAPAQMDAHRVPYPDASFDHVICHAGLHHCSRPHEALHEMYRMARKTVMFVENQDSLLMRLATRAGLVSWHELRAVIGEGYLTGGVDGTAVPNFIYRWTRRELRKTVATYDPAYDVPIEFHTEWNVGAERAAVEVLQRRLHLHDGLARRIFVAGQWFMNTFLGGQGNIFAATIRKDLAALHSWMATPEQMRRLEA